MGKKSLGKTRRKVNACENPVNNARGFIAPSGGQKLIC